LGGHSRAKPLPAGVRAVKTASWRKLLCRAAAIAGMAFLSYAAGAAVMAFGLPSSKFMSDAFSAGPAFFEWHEAYTDTSSPSPPPPPPTIVDQPDKTFEGFTLYATDSGSRAFLINMRGDVVHQWSSRFSTDWSAPERKRPALPGPRISFFGCRVDPDGNLLAVYHALGDTPYGYGLTKLDKDSNVVWEYSAHVHHDLDVGDDAVIYALTQEIVQTVPQGLEYIETPCLVDYVVKLSPGGKELKKTPLLEAFRDSPYAVLLTALERAPHSGPSRGGPAMNHPQDTQGDILHTNSVRVLNRNLAPHFPMFKEGQVLLSVRQLDTLAVLDMESGSIVWGARGPWMGQHDAHFLENGHILLLDNLGSAEASRVLEYDPLTHAFPWWYSGDAVIRFIDRERCMCQRLPNGNTLMVNSKDGKVLEVSTEKELVWSCLCQGHVTCARRYGPSEIRFLKADVR
jgi:hypothetical protein